MAAKKPARKADKRRKGKAGRRDLSPSPGASRMVTGGRRRYISN